jgi:hypothetical protein
MHPFTGVCVYSRVRDASIYGFVFDSRPREAVLLGRPFSARPPGSRFKVHVSAFPVQILEPIIRSLAAFGDPRQNRLRADPKKHRHAQTAAVPCVQRLVLKSHLGLYKEQHLLVR